jgi:hypothetical protein
LVGLELDAKRKVLLIWLLFSGLTSVITVVYLAPNSLQSAVYVLFTAMLVLNSPVWAVVFVWHLIERARSTPWRALLFLTLFFNFLAGFTVLSIWRSFEGALVGYLIILVNSIIAAFVFDDLFPTIVLTGIGTIASSIASVFILMLPALLFGGPSEQIYYGALIYVQDTFYKLIIVLPLSMLAGLIGNFFADWVLRTFGTKGAAI